ncbi:MULTISPECIES: PAS and ANTAR domain-containing protein [Arthrobacter]|uniref:ANTAR domain-containing protein n=1 Tax=Arthrobacter terricola TaxID=2547396 RepID=A0A4R5KK70_9MICC|nr:MULTISPECIES: PAS and ANTAR domain-containing protein [Arthrobacter]MBT8159288.1 PAS and ANTAR domain-containing protein [Arthrobacter sp. GN70]TDF94887.1 ANTAR domain-containing protein [Arthrobacter terricola]
MAILDGPHAYSSALGAVGLMAGSFHFDPLTGKAEWSDGLFNLHGYERGEVVPSFELLMSHKHPEDRPRIRAILEEVFQNGGHFCIYHRIVDARQHIRRVMTAGVGRLNDDGIVSRLDGTTMDLTSTIHRETSQAARDAVAGAHATRGAINQARGILMGWLMINSDEAFQLLVSASSRANVKVAVLANQLIRLADSNEGPKAVEEFIRALRG